MSDEKDNIDGRETSDEIDNNKGIDFRDKNIGLYSNISEEKDIDDISGNGGYEVGKDGGFKEGTFMQKSSVQLLTIILSIFAFVTMTTTSYLVFKDDSDTFNNLLDVIQELTTLIALFAGYCFSELKISKGKNT